METTNTPTPAPPRRQWVRPRDNRVLAGVAAGLGDRLGISIGVLRIGFLVATLFGGFGIVAYAAAWALMPASDEVTSPGERWLHDLQTPGRRTAAVLIGLAGLIVLIPFAPVALLVAAAVVVGALLTRRGDATTKEI